MAIFRRIKKILMSGLIVTLISSSAVPASAQYTGHFEDVPSNHPNFTAIEELAKRGFVAGYPDGTFRPSRIVNRAEVTAMIIRALGQEPDPGKFVNCFDDVRDEWFSRYVCFGKTERSRWLSGYPGTQEFRPEIHIIVAEALRMSIDAFDIQRISAVPILKSKWDVPYGYKNRPQDFKTVQWWEDYMVTARQLELIDNTPLANNLMTRAEMAEVIYRSWRYSELGASGVIKEGGLEESSLLD